MTRTWRRIIVAALFICSVPQRAGRTWRVLASARWRAQRSFMAFRSAFCMR